MSLRDPTLEDGAIEECLDELNDCVATLARYPPTVLAVAMRVHLESLLRVVLERGRCTREERKSPSSVTPRERATNLMASLNSLVLDGALVEGTLRSL